MTADRLVEFMDHEDNKGKLPSFSWPGSYPMFYITQGGDELCADCATSELRAWLAEDDWGSDPPTCYGAYGATDDYPECPATCANCNKVICEPMEA